MSPTNFPDDKTWRRIEAMRRSMPTQAQREAMEQASALAGLRQTAEHAAQVRRVVAGISGPGSEFYKAMQQVHLNFQQVVKPFLDSQVMRALAQVDKEREKTFLLRGSAVGEIVKTMNQIQASIPYETLASLRNALAHANDGPVRAAIETIKNLNLENVSPVLEEFVEDALTQSEPLTKKTLKKVSKAHLSKKKLSQLSPQEQFWIMFVVQVLTLLIAYFQLVQAGKPVQIDPEQLSKLNQPQINIKNIFQAIQTEPVYYLVMRDCVLIPKPGKTRVVIYSLPPGTKVKLMLSNHQWIYVHFEDGNVSKEGWVRKKYLRRLPP